MKMKILSIATGYVSENCYILTAGSTLYVIDPGADPQAVCGAISKFDGSFDNIEILLTHAHADHIGAVGELCRKLNVSAVRLGKEDKAVYHSPDNSFPPFIPLAEDLPETCEYTENSDYNVISCPGHTPGGVSLLFDFDGEKHLFTGDTLFAGSIGRTDFEGGNMQDMTATLKMLCRLPDDIIIHPGHGPESTIGREKSTNCYLTEL